MAESPPATAMELIALVMDGIAAAVEPEERRRTATLFSLRACTCLRCDDSLNYSFIHVLHPAHRVVVNREAATQLEQRHRLFFLACAGFSLKMSTSSGEDHDDQVIWDRIDNINLTIYDEEILGLPNVRHGSLHDRQVCVKSIVEEKFHPREIHHLTLCQGIPNVIQFYMGANQDEYEHVVLEPYWYTLETFLAKRNDLVLHHGYPTALLYKLIGDMVQGLFDIHRIRLIHGNITPWNIMVVESHEDDVDRKYIAKISDLGMSRRLELGNEYLHGRTRMTLDNDTRDYFWPAPEQRVRNRKHGQKIDVFNLGCVIAYCVIGNHPFGEEEDQTRLDNIRNNGDNIDMPLINELPDDNPVLKDLIKSMVKRDNRASINQVKAHPLFWSLSKQTQFVELASDFLQGYHMIRISIDNETGTILGNDIHWRARAVSQEIWNCVIGGRLAYEDTVSSLLRFIRNQSSHRREWQAPLLATYGTVDNLLNHFLLHYPRLVIDVYRALKDVRDLRNMPEFNCYYFTTF